MSKSSWIELDLSDISGESIETFCSVLQERLFELKEKAKVPKDVSYSIEVDVYNEDLTFYYQGKPDTYDLESYREEVSNYTAMEKWKEVVDAEYEKLVIEDDKRHNDSIHKQIEELKSKLK